MSVFDEAIDKLREERNTIRSGARPITIVNRTTNPLFVNDHYINPGVTESVLALPNGYIYIHCELGSCVLDFSGIGMFMTYDRIAVTEESKYVFVVSEAAVPQKSVPEKFVYCPYCGKVLEAGR